MGFGKNRARQRPPNRRMVGSSYFGLLPLHMSRGHCTASRLGELSQGSIGPDADAACEGLRSTPRFAVRCVSFLIQSVLFLWTSLDFSMYFTR